MTVPAPSFPGAGGALEVHQIPAATDNLIWVLVCTATGETAAVDGPGAEEVLAFCRERGLHLGTVLNTHTHGDHIGINHALRGAGLLESMRVVGCRTMAAAIPGLTEPVDEGDVVRVGAVTGRVMRTEGHIDGHLSYVFDDVLFCGDTLFTAGCGYLFDGPPAKMFRSLQRLAELPGSTRVCCAHEYTLDNLLFAWFVEPDNEALLARIRAVRALREAGGCAVPSTIETERATNPFLRPGSPTLRAVVAREMPGADLSTPEGVFAATRALKDTRRHRERSFPA